MNLKDQTTDFIFSKRFSNPVTEIQIKAKKSISSHSQQHNSLQQQKLQQQKQKNQQQFLQQFSDQSYAYDKDKLQALLVQQNKLVDYIEKTLETVDFKKTTSRQSSLNFQKYQKSLSQAQLFKNNNAITFNSKINNSNSNNFDNSGQISINQTITPRESQQSQNTYYKTNNNSINQNNNFNQNKNQKEKSLKNSLSFKNEENQRQTWIHKLTQSTYNIVWKQANLFYIKVLYCFIKNQLPFSYPFKEFPKEGPVPPLYLWELSYEIIKILSKENSLFDQQTRDQILYIKDTKKKQIQDKIKQKKKQFQEEQERINKFKNDQIDENYQKLQEKKQNQNEENVYEKQNELLIQENNQISYNQCNNQDQSQIQSQYQQDNNNNQKSPKNALRDSKIINQSNNFQNNNSNYSNDYNLSLKNVQLISNPKNQICKNKSLQKKQQIKTQKEKQQNQREIQINDYQFENINFIDLLNNQDNSQIQSLEKTDKNSDNFNKKQIQQNEEEKIQQFYGENNLVKKYPFSTGHSQNQQFNLINQQQKFLNQDELTTKNQENDQQFLINENGNENQNTNIENQSHIKYLVQSLDQFQNQTQNPDQIQNYDHNQIQNQNKNQNQSLICTENQIQNQNEIQNQIQNEIQNQNQNQIQNQNQNQSEIQIQNQNQIQSEDQTQKNNNKDSQSQLSEIALLKQEIEALKLKTLQQQVYINQLKNDQLQQIALQKFFLQDSKKSLYNNKQNLLQKPPIDISNIISFINQVKKQSVPNKNSYNQLQQSFNSSKLNQSLRSIVQQQQLQYQQQDINKNSFTNFNNNSFFNNQNNSQGKTKNNNLSFQNQNQNQNQNLSQHFYLNQNQSQIQNQNENLQNQQQKTLNSLLCNLALFMIRNAEKLDSHLEYLTLLKQIDSMLKIQNIPNKSQSELEENSEFNKENSINLTKQISDYKTLYQKINLY
ncbi:hypothetical protein PPERSA_13172 [Pseudocohnilembus persalinus]|uniref:Uncharacterized protein n=1 Tax=Pseudocohnilembus persalinus TaxID=266149 RepID=A0A0V0QL17_PSEPJ|nr:hypothetical protein PPERSA_13172 [Pseudocohnilembus persalinus]|eukprot:KRX02918.1 hypothetical protein PPERSA_13172 [Pseudocohnilembus persalinus]